MGGCLIFNRGKISSFFSKKLIYMDMRWMEICFVENIYMNTDKLQRI